MQHSSQLAQCLILLILLCAVSAAAQVSWDTIERQSQVYVWADVPGDGPADIVTSTDFGDFVEPLAVSMGAAASQAQQTSQAITGPGWIACGGHCEAAVQQTTVGTQHTMYANTYAIAYFSIASASNYRFELNVLDNSGDVDAELVNVGSGQSVFLATTDLGEHVYEGQLAYPVQYCLVIRAHAEWGTDQLVDLAAAFDFDLSVALDGVVAAETSTWSNVKSLYR